MHPCAASSDCQTYHEDSLRSRREQVDRGNDARTKTTNSESSQGLDTPQSAALFIGVSTIAYNIVSFSEPHESHRSGCSQRSERHLLLISPTRPLRAGVCHGTSRTDTADILRPASQRVPTRGTGPGCREGAARVKGVSSSVEAEGDHQEFHKPPWPNGQGVGPLIQRLWARVPQGVCSGCSHAACVTSLSGQIAFCAFS